MPDKVKKTEKESFDLTQDEWKKRLTPEQYEVLRKKGTETPFTGEYVHTKDKGMYACAACVNELFSSETKFDSGTGWPSFDKALPGAVKYHEDDLYGMNRIEVTCAKCGSHLGHVFNDGPRETTGERYCINSCALKLKKNSDK